MSRNLPALCLALLVASGLAFAPSAAQAQKGLVYCPVAIDGSGCAPIVTALTADATSFPDGVDTGFDGSSGTVDLATADLSSYAVLVVPSLAEGAGVDPYIRLRDQQVASRLSAAFTGRNAVWSGTPDLGTTNRAAKDALLRNLAGWAKGGGATGRGPGIVVLQDNSDDAGARYGWLTSISGLSVVADTTFEVYSNVQVLTSTGRQLLTNSSGLQIGYTNMAAYGLIASGSGVSNDATGGRTTRVVLVTTAGEASDPSLATVQTDKEDYQPGDTVVVTGAGWAPGETVDLLFHEDVDPPIHPDKSFTAVADADGHIGNRQYELDPTDLDVRFTLTATGQTSGKTAQATFTDAQPVAKYVASITTAAQTGCSSITFTLTITNDATSTMQLGSANITVPSGYTSVSVGTITPPATKTWTASLSSGVIQLRASTNTSTNTLNPGQAVIVQVTATPLLSGGTFTWATAAREKNDFTGTTFDLVGADPTVTVTTGTNTAPSFTKGPNQTVLEDAAAQSVASWATAISAGPACESGQTVTFNVTNNNNSLFLVQPAVSSAGSLTYTPASNANGSATVSVTASDGLSSSATQTFTITVTAVNDAPSFTKGANQTVLEDAPAQSIAGWATNLSVGPANESTQSLTGFTVTNNNNALFSVQPAVAVNGTLTYTPAANANGNATVTVTLSDDGGTDNGGQNTSASQTFSINVTAVNDAPSFTKGADQVVAQGSGSQSVTGWATNISPGPANESGQTVSFNVTGNTNPGLFTTQPAVSSTGTLTYTPKATESGVATITLVIQDDGGTLNGGQNTSATQSFTITVNPANQPPVAVDDNYSVDEDGVLTVAARGVLTNDTDPENDPLTAAQNGNPAHGTATLASDGSFTYTPTGNYFGPDGFNYKANDGQANSGLAMVRITVNPVNDPPSFNAITDQTYTEGATATPISITGITAGPGETQTLTFTVTNDKNSLFSVQPSVGTITSGTAPLSYTLAAGQTGTANVTVTLQDNGGTAKGGSDTFSQMFKVTVTPKRPTTTLVTSDTPDPSIEGDAITVGVSLSPTTGTGNPSGTVTVSDGVDSCSPAITLNSSGTGSCSLTLSTLGSRTITATYSGDATFAGSAGTASHQVNSRNSPPVLANVPPSATIDELAPYTFTATATDPESPPQTLTFSLVSAPTGASIGASTGIFTWTPTEAQGPGSYPFKVRVSDNATPALFDEKSMTLTVNEVNAAPVLGDIADKSVRWGHTLSFTASATDGDDPPQSLTFSFGPGAPVTATINGSGVFSWTPTASDVGDHPITVKVSDGLASDSKSFTVTVQKHPTAVVYDGAISAPYKGSPAFRATLTDADADPGTPLSGKSIRFTLGSQYVDATTMSAGAAGVASATLTLDASQHAGPYTVESFFTGDGAYESSGDSDPFTISKAHATLTIDPTKLSFPYDGSSKSATVATDPTGLDGVHVTYQEGQGQPTETAPTDAGSYAVVAKLDNTDYEADNANATLDIAKATQLITFPAIAGKTFGDASFAAGATINSTLAIEYSATGKCTVASNGTVTITGAGSCNVTAKQPGDKNHFAATDQSESFNIEKATPVITWADPDPIGYGTALSGTQLNATVSGVHEASVAGGFAYNPASGAYLNAGTQSLSTTFTPSGTDADNYKSAQKSVSLTVNKAPLTVTAHDNTKVYGEPVPSLDGEITGFVLGQNASVLTQQPTFTTTATPTSDVPGPYAINGSGAAADNYDFKYVAGKLAVTKATPAFSNLTSPTITYGAASTTFSGVISTAFVYPSGNVTITVNGASVSAPINSADGTFSASIATGLFNVPTTPYTVTYSFAGAEPNFNAAVNGIGTLTVNKATPVINWIDPAQMVFGQALSGTQLNATVTGVGGSAVAGTLAYSPSLGTVLPVGLQALSVLFTPTGTDANNYKTATKGVQVAVLYNRAVGTRFLQPVNLYPDPRSSFKITSTIPVKFQLFLADGVTPYAGANATIQLIKISSSSSDQVNEEIITTPADNGTTFRYDATGKQYIYNMGTKTLSQGMYTINADLHDGGPPVTATVELRAK